MATAKPASARLSASARPIRRAPPVTSAAGGTGRVAKPPVNSPGALGLDAGTALLAASAHLGPHHFAGRHAGAAGGRAAARPARRGRCGEPQFGLFEPADLVAQPRGFLEFQLGGGAAHALFEIGDDRLQVLALVMQRVAFAEPERYVVALIDAVEDVGDAVPDALWGDAVGGIVGLLLFAPPV